MPWLTLAGIFTVVFAGAMLATLAPARRAARAAPAEALRYPRTGTAHGASYGWTRARRDLPSRAMTLAMAPLTARRRALLGALATGTTYGDPACEVSCHETHGSWVFVPPDRVLKVKKPLKLSFLDYGTRERRGAMCREEVRINRRLAPELYLGTVGLVPRSDGGVDLDPDDEAFESVEPAVLMRRFDERDTLASRLEAGTATPAQLRALGARLAASTPRIPTPSTPRPRTPRCATRSARRSTTSRSRVTCCPAPMSR